MVSKVRLRTIFLASFAPFLSLEALSLDSEAVLEGAAEIGGSGATAGTARLEAGGVPEVLWATFLLVVRATVLEAAGR